MLKFASIMASALHNIASMQTTEHNLVQFTIVVANIAEEYNVIIWLWHPADYDKMFFKEKELNEMQWL